MRLLKENNQYSNEEIISQIENELGFVYVKESDSSGYIILGEGVRLTLKFEDGKLVKSVIVLPTNTLEITHSNIKADLYLSCIESAEEVIDVVDRLTGDHLKDSDESVVEEVEESLEFDDHNIIPYKGYNIEVGLYDVNDITVQYNGDDIFFDSIEDAKKFIDKEI